MIILSIDTSQSASVALVDTDTGSVIAAEQEIGRASCRERV